MIKAKLVDIENNTVDETSATLEDASSVDGGVKMMVTFDRPLVAGEGQRIVVECADVEFSVKPIPQAPKPQAPAPKPVDPVKTDPKPGDA